MSSRTSSEATAGLSHKRARSDDPGDASPPRRSAVAGPSRSTRRSEEPRSSSSGPAFSVGNPFKSIKRPRKRTAPPDLRDNDREPSTEEEEEDPAKQEQGASTGASTSNSRYQRSRSRTAAVKADSEDDEEPSTAESGDEPIVAFGSRTLPARSSRNTAPVLDLTDSGDEGFSSLSPGLAYGSSSRPNALANGAADASSAPRPHLNIRPGDSLFGTLSAIDDDDDESLVFEDAAAVRAKRAEKGKGKARDASSPPVPLADSTSSANNAAATTADSRPLPSLSHLTCPICFGPPAPLALTSCGHAFCAPCLHAALVAGPALTPPPTGTAAAARRGRGGRTGPMGEVARLFNTGGRGRGRTARGGFAGRAAGGGDDGGDEDDPELNKHCPVCRTPLYGGWGKSLRGLVLRMAPIKR